MLHDVLSFVAIDHRMRFLCLFTFRFFSFWSFLLKTPIKTFFFGSFTGKKRGKRFTVLLLFRKVLLPKNFDYAKCFLFYLSVCFFFEKYNRFHLCFFFISSRTLSTMFSCNFPFFNQPIIHSAWKEKRTGFRFVHTTFCTKYVEEEVIIRSFSNTKYKIFQHTKYFNNCFYNFVYFYCYFFITNFQENFFFNEFFLSLLFYTKFILKFLARFKYKSRLSNCC